MTRRAWLATAGGLAPVAAAVWLVPGTARAVQLGFVVAGAAPIGAVLMLAIARVTGARWDALAPLVRAMPAVVVLAALAMLAGAGTPLPPHLTVWQHPLFAATRAVVATGALTYAGQRLVADASATFAGVTLALYAAFVTPVATDWLMVGAPGHAVSAAGMMLAVQQIGAASAAALLLGLGDARRRQDWAKLLVAAALGLCYLAFMDYLIVWFGNLPTRVPFYAVRGTPPQAMIVGAALAIGLGGTIAALASLPDERGRRLASGTALAGLLLFDLWWLGATPWIAVLTALPLCFGTRRRVHG